MRLSKGNSECDMTAINITDSVDSRFRGVDGSEIQDTAERAKSRRTQLVRFFTSFFSKTNCNNAIQFSTTH